MPSAEASHLATQLARGEVFNANCPSREVLVHLTGKWNVLETMRFSDLRRKVNGVSERMLAKSLQQLERHRLLVRRSYPVVPPHVDYTLTPLGRDAAARIAGLTDCIELYRRECARADRRGMTAFEL